MNNNEEQHESVWSKAIPFKEQVDIFKRLMGFVKQFKFEMVNGETVRFLARIRVNVDIKTGKTIYFD